MLSIKDQACKPARYSLDVLESKFKTPSPRHQLSLFPVFNVQTPTTSKGRKEISVKTMQAQRKKRTNFPP
jgi:hypothetical protein